MTEVESCGLAIDIDKVTVRYGKLLVLDELSLQVPAGISFGLLGPNGAGKTTLIRLLAALLPPGSGRVRVLGEKPSRETAHLIGYMPQLQSLYLDLSARQNVDFFARIYRLRRDERRHRVEEVLRLVGLWSRRDDSVHKFSGGMKQRVSLACAIVHQPQLLLLDEPTVGLDPELRVIFWQHFSALTRRGVTIVITSHTMDDAAHCDQLAFVREGKIIACGTPDELRRSTGKSGTSLEEAFLYCIRREGKTDV